MADKRIQDLTPASSVQTSDRFVLEQSGQAKSLTGQILINDLAAFLDGHGGINDISYTPPSSGSLTGTLTVTLADETVETFSVTNGRGIASFAKTGTSGLVDTYQITYNDGSTPTTFTVTNGREITSVEKVDTTGLVDTYEISYNDGSAPTEFTITNGRGIESIGYVESVGLDDYYQIDYNDGEATSFIVHNGEKGDTGDNWYVHIKWAAVMPTQDSDMVNIPSDFIGIYAGISATAPTDYTEYAWYDYKGEKGDTGTSISSVAWQSSSGLVDTYRVNFDDGNSTTFNVTNGSNISSITKTSTVGLVDTYTVLLTNGNQTSFQVNNGKSIVSIAWTNTTSPTGVPHVPGATDTYTVSYNDGDSTTFQVYNGLDGEGASITVDGIPSVNGNVPLLVIDTEHGAPTPQTQGSVKSRYFDAINSVLYICLGYDENNGYIWRGAGVTVDSALSTSSTNPVQNRVITNKIGTAALDTTAQDLSGAVNEILDDISGFADNLAEEYDPTSTYAVGDLCIYDNVLYRCNTAISTPEAWNSIHWTATSVDEELDGKVSKSGDTMTGILRFQDDSSNPNIRFYGYEAEVGTASNKQTGAVSFLDKNGVPVGQIYGGVNSSGNPYLALYSRRTVNGSTAYNNLQLIVNANGNASVSMNSPGAWRSAIGAVSKDGDTMTGDLTIQKENAAEYLKNTAADTSLATDTALRSWIIGHRDKNNRYASFWQTTTNTSGRTTLAITARKYINNANVNNTLNLFVDADGTKTVSVTDPDAWRDALGLGTSGALPITIAQGGTGQGSVTTITTMSTIATAGANITIQSGEFTYWGKVAQFNIVIKANAAIASGATVFTLKSGYRPAADANGTFADARWMTIGTNGTVHPQSAISSGSTYAFRAFYLLA